MNMVNSEFIELKTWMNINKLSINENKTKAMFLELINPIQNYQYAKMEL